MKKNREALMSFSEGARTAEIFQLDDAYHVKCTSLKGKFYQIFDNLGDATIAAKIAVSQAILADDVIEKSLENHMPTFLNDIIEEYRAKLEKTGFSHAYIKDVATPVNLEKVKENFAIAQRSRAKSRDKNVTVGEAIRLYLLELPYRVEIGSLSAKRHQSERARALKIKASIGSYRITNIDELVISNFLDEISSSEATRDSYISTLRCALRPFKKSHGIERKYIPRGTVKPSTIISPDELIRLLSVAKSQYDLLHIVLGAFAGMRESEIQRFIMTYKYDPNRTTITLTEKQTKTRRERAIEITPQLKAWFDFIGNLPDANELKCDCKNELTLNKILVKTYRWTPLDRLLRTAKIPPRPNGLRRSFASYHIQLFENAWKTSLICGHSVAVLESTYKKVLLPGNRGISKGTAEKWFNILPRSILHLGKLRFLRGMERAYSQKRSSIQTIIDEFWGRAKKEQSYVKASNATVWPLDEKSLKQLTSSDRSENTAPKEEFPSPLFIDSGLRSTIAKQLDLGTATLELLSSNASENLEQNETLGSLTE